MITGFGHGNDYAYGVAVQSDGKIVVAGTVADASSSDFGVARYNTNGTLDNTFGSDGKVSTGFGATDGANAVALQSDGKIVAAGFTNSSGGDDDYALVRYNTNGTLDNSFSGDGKVIFGFGFGDDVASAVGIQTNGKIVIAGNAYDGNTIDFGVARLNTNGSLDNTFSGDGMTLTGFGADDIARAVAIQSDGKIIAAGDKHLGFGNYSVVMARYKTNGGLDNTFGSDGNGKVTTGVDGAGESAKAIAIQSNSKIVLAGNTTESGGDQDFLVLRYHGDNAAPEIISGISNDDAKIAEKKLSSLHIYPNPVVNMLHVEGLNASSPVTISIIELSGTVLQKTTVKGNEYAFDVSMLRPGMYYVSIVEKDKTVNLKFMKE